MTSMIPRIAKSKKIFSVLILMMLVILIFSGCGILTVVRNSDGKIINGINKGEYLIDEENFDADKYVEEIWADDVLPYIDETAQDYMTVVNAIKADFQQAGEKYGRARSSNADTYNFIIKCQASVLEVNNDSRVGYMLMDVAPCDGAPDFKLMIGPVYKGDSLRNSLEFVEFSMFTSQNDYADVSKSLHKMVDAQVIPQIDTQNATGKQFEFIGTFTSSESTDEYLVTPVIIQSGGR